MIERTKPKRFLVDIRGRLHWEITTAPGCDEVVYLTPQEVEDYGDKCSSCLQMDSKYVEVEIKMYWEWRNAHAEGPIDYDVTGEANSGVRGSFLDG